MVGVHYQQAAVSLLMIVGSFLAFFCLPVPPSFFCLAVLLLACSCASLVRCATMDPGILPRCPASPMIDLMPDTVKAKIAYCHTCHVVRAPRTKHCRHCDACIVGFDRTFSFRRHMNE